MARKTKHWWEEDDLPADMLVVPDCCKDSPLTRTLTAEAETPDTFARRNILEPWDQWWFDRLGNEWKMMVDALHPSRRQVA